MAGVEADPDPGLVGHQVQDLAQLAQVPAHRAALPAGGFRIRIQSGQWIRIQEGKNDPQK